MKTIFSSLLLFIILSFSGFAQNWFPLEVGNKILSRYPYTYQGGDFVSYYLISIEEDSILNKKMLTAYDPSPVQMLFSEDSIYIQTLADSGSIKISNTSDSPVRIDSLISVGSLYGYWGNFTKPGFEFPFYLFQTLPGYWNDTLNIIIPPHDSINVSFSNVDLCPMCSNQVNEYFKDTLIFKFTFLGSRGYSFSKSIQISGEGHLSDVEEDDIIPGEFALNQNYPNPFNPSTTLSFVIGHQSFVTLKVYDVLGNEVATLVNEEKPAGKYEVQFTVGQSSTCGASPDIASGIYFYKLQTGSFTQTRKMILMK